MLMQEATGSCRLRLTTILDEGMLLYDDVTRALWRIKPPTTLLFVQKRVNTNNKEIINYFVWGIYL